MEKNTKASLVLVIGIFCFLLSIKCIAQASTDSSKQNELYTTLAPRIGLGIHSYLNAELGLTLVNVSDRALQWGAASAYATAVFQQSGWNTGFNIVGCKLGVQSSWAIFMWGIELKYLRYRKESLCFLSPKIGLSWLDVLNVEYAYNVLNLNRTVPINTNHQFSINISINRKIYKNILQRL